MSVRGQHLKGAFMMERLLNSLASSFTTDFMLCDMPYQEISRDELELAYNHEHVCMLMLLVILKTNGYKINQYSIPTNEDIGLDTYGGYWLSHFLCDRESFFKQISSDLFSYEFDEENFVRNMDESMDMESVNEFLEENDIDPQNLTLEDEEYVWGLTITLITNPKIDRGIRYYKEHGTKKEKKRFFHLLRRLTALCDSTCVISQVAPGNRWYTGYFHEEDSEDNGYSLYHSGVVDFNQIIIVMMMIDLMLKDI